MQVKTALCMEVQLTSCTIEQQKVWGNKKDQDCLQGDRHKVHSMSWEAQDAPAIHTEGTVPPCNITA